MIGSYISVVQLT